MVFADDDFEHMVNPTGLEVLYPEVVVIREPEDSTLDDYLEQLSGGRELVHHYLHSTAQNLYFYDCAEWDVGGDECLRWYGPILHRTQIGPSTLMPSQNLEVSFVNMYNCHAARFTQPNLGMSFTLQTDYGLATVGNTRKGGMTNATVFHEALGEGASWGEAYKRWYNEVGKHNDRWFLGVVLTGDPTLTIPIEPGDRPAIEALASQPEPVETPRELTATDPPGSVEDYKRQNPQFFKD